MMNGRSVYVVLFQMDESMPAEVVGVYETAESANEAANKRGHWVVVSDLSV
jgi:hypothetical protein